MAYNTIKIRKYSDVVEEHVAASTITPGQLLELTSADKVQAHSHAAGNVLPMFALEDEMQGKEIGDTIAAAGQVQCWIPNRGDVVLGILADGQSVVIGDLLVSNGDGSLKKYVPSDDSDYTQHPNQIVGAVMEAKDLSGSSGEEEAGGVLDFAARVKVRIL